MQDASYDLNGGFSQEKTMCSVFTNRENCDDLTVSI